MAGKELLILQRVYAANYAAEQFLGHI